MKLHLEVWNDSGKSHFATLEERELAYRIGRDLTCDLPIPSQALSREHGEFFGFPTGWVYRDLSSTNGSWLNGNVINKNQLIALRQGDALQLADVVLKIQYDKVQIDTSDSVRSGLRLFVVREGIEFLELNPQQFEGTIVTEFGISFELKDEGLFLEFESPDVEIELNQSRISNSQKLQNNDYLKVSEVEFLVVEGILGAPVTQPTKDSTVMIPEHVRVNLDLTAAAAPDGNQPKASVFSPERTTVIDPSRVGSLRFGESFRQDDSSDDEYAPNSRMGRMRTNENEGARWFDFGSLSDAEKAVVIGIVFFVFASLSLLLMWFFLVR